MPNKEIPLRRSLRWLVPLIIGSYFLANCAPITQATPPSPTTDQPIVSPSPEYIFTPTLLPPTVTPQPTPFEIESLPGYVEPEVLEGVNVYGLSEKINSVEQIIDLYSSLDAQFAQQHGITIDNKYNQRKELLPADERYLEVVITQSAWDSYLKHAPENGADFLELTKMQVDTMNMMIKNAKPPSALRTVLRRIIIIDDSIANSIWDKKTPFDQSYVGVFNGSLPIDTDINWAINSNLVNGSTGLRLSYLYQFIHQDGKFKFAPFSTGAPKSYQYEFPEEENSLTNRNAKTIDLGTIHEWFHRLYGTKHDNLIMEGTSGLADITGFSQFRIDESSFHSPDLSPYISSFLNNNLRIKARGTYDFDYESTYTDRPDEIQISVSAKNVVQMQIFQEKQGSGNSIYFHNAPDQITDPYFVPLSGLEDLDQYNAENFTHFYIVKAVFPDGTHRSVVLPTFAMEMSKWAGVENAYYFIKFNADVVSKPKSIQSMKMLDQSELALLDPESYYASMKVAGTNTWFVWFSSN